MLEPPFKVGDMVRLTTGQSPIMVLEVYFFSDEKDFCFSYAKSRFGKKPRKGWFVRFRYLSSINHPDEPKKWREAEDFVLYDPLQPRSQPRSQPPEEATAMTEIYQTKKEPARYGTMVAVNSLKQVVLEMKGEGGRVEAFNSDEIELVLPYSVSLQRTRIEGGTEALIHVVSEPGVVAVDDFLMELNTGHFWRVVKVDARVKSPKENKSKWMKFKGEAVSFGEE